MTIGKCWFTVSFLKIIRLDQSLVRLFCCLQSTLKVNLKLPNLYAVSDATERILKIAG